MPRLHNQESENAGNSKNSKGSNKPATSSKTANTDSTAKENGLDPQSTKICINVYKNLRHNKPKKEIIPLAASLTGVPESKLVSIIEDYKKSHKDNMVPGTQHNSYNNVKPFDWQITKTLIGIERTMFPSLQAANVRHYQKKLNKQLKCNLSKDEVKKWLAIIGIKTEEDIKSQEANQINVNTETQSNATQNLDKSTPKLGEGCADTQANYIEAGTSQEVMEISKIKLDAENVNLEAGESSFKEGNSENTIVNEEMQGSQDIEEYYYVDEKSPEEIEVPHLEFANEIDFAQAFLNAEGKEYVDQPDLVEIQNLYQVKPDLYQVKPLKVGRRFGKKVIPPLDYFVEQLKEKHFKYSRTEIARLLNKLNIKYTITERLRRLRSLETEILHDSEVTRLLKQINADFSLEKKVKEVDVISNSITKAANGDGEEVEIIEIKEEEYEDVEEINSILEDRRKPYSLTKNIKDVIVNHLIEIEKQVGSHQIASLDYFLDELTKRGFRYIWKTKIINLLNTIGIRYSVKEKPIEGSQFTTNEWDEQIINHLIDIENRMETHEVASLDFYREELKKRGFEIFLKSKIKGLLNTIGIKYFGAEKRIESSTENELEEDTEDEVIEENLNVKTEIDIDEEMLEDIKVEIDEFENAEVQCKTENVDLNQLDDIEAELKPHIISRDFESQESDEEENLTGEIIPDNEVEPDYEIIYSSPKNTPTLDYFVDLLEEKNHRHSKSTVAQCLKKLKIEFTGDYKEDLDTAVIDDTTIPSLLKKFYLNYLLAQKKNSDLQSTEIVNNSIDIKTEQRLINIAKNCQNKGKIPTISSLLKSLRVFDENITKDSLRMCLNKLNIEYKERRRPCKKPRTSDDGSSSMALSQYRKNKLRKELLLNSDFIPSLDYFYKNFNLNHHKCSKSTIRKWLEFLSIQFSSSESDLKEETCTQPEEQLSSAVVRDLLHLEDEFHKNANPIKTADIEASKEMKTEPDEEVCQNMSEENLNTLILNPFISNMEFCEVKNDSLQYLYETLDKVISQKKITDLDSNVPDLMTFQLTSNIMRLFIHLDDYFKTPKRDLKNAILNALKDLDNQLKIIGERSLLNYIHECKATPKLLECNQSYSIEKLKKRLTIIKFNFKHELDEELKNSESLPTLDYFYDKLNRAQHLCGMNNVKKWLEFLNIPFDENNCDLERHSQKESSLTPRIAKFLIQCDEFSEKGEKYYTHFQVLKDMDYMFKIRGKIPSLNFIHQYLISKPMRLNPYYSKDILKAWLVLLDIKFTVDIPHIEKSSELVPSLEYFCERLKESKYTCGKTIVKGWLDFLDIKYNVNGYDLFLINAQTTSWQLTPPLVKLLKKFDYDFDVLTRTNSTYFSALRDLESQLNVICLMPTLNFIHGFIVSSNFFQKDVVYTKRRLKEWLGLLRMYYIDEDEVDNVKISPDILPSLDYFYDRAKELNYEGDRATIKECLEHLNIQFELNNCDLELGSRNLDTDLSPFISMYLKKFDDDFKATVSKYYPYFLGLLTFNSIYQTAGKTATLNTFHEQMLLVAQSDLSSSEYSKDKLKEWLNMLKIKFVYEKPKVNSDQLPPLDYFYRKLNEAKYKCEKSTLKKWLGFLDINFRNDTDEINETNSDSDYQLTSNVVRLLKKYDKEYIVFIREPATNELLRRLESEFKNKGEVPTLSFIDQYLTMKLNQTNLMLYSKENLRKLLTVLNIAFIDDEVLMKTLDVLPTVDYFANILEKAQYVCSKNTVKSWLESLGIQYDKDSCDVDPNCSKSLLKLSPPATKLLIKSNIAFERCKPSLPYGYYQTFKDLDYEYRVRGEVPTLKYIKQRLVSIKTPPNFYKSLSDEKLKEWLTLLKIKFIEKEPESVEYPFSYYEESVPSLDYFYEQLQPKVCCKALLKKWLELISISFHSKFTNLQKCSTFEETLSSPIIRQLVAHEESFFKNKLLFNSLSEMLGNLWKEFQKQSRIPSLNFIHQYVLSSRMFQNEEFYSINNLEIILNKLKIAYTTEESNTIHQFDKNTPTLDYFYQKLQAKDIDVSLYELNVWLKEIGIAFKNENTDLNNKIFLLKPLSQQITSLLHEFANEFRLKNLITDLKDLEKDFTQRKKPLTFSLIYEMIKNFKIFNSTDAESKKDVLKSWVQNLGIAFIDDDLNEEMESAPPLNYYYKECTGSDNFKNSSSATEQDPLLLESVQEKNISTPPEIEFIEVEDSLESNSEKDLPEIIEEHVPEIVEIVDDDDDDDDDEPVETKKRKKLKSKASKSRNGKDLRKQRKFKSKQRQDSSSVHHKRPNLSEQKRKPRFLKRRLEKLLNAPEPAKKSKSWSLFDCSNESSTPPDSAMKLLTDVEYIFHKMKQVPTLDHFYKELEGKYSKETIKKWLTRAGIRYQR